MRDSVLWFAEIMEKKLQANDHKVGWNGLPDPYFIQRAQGELQELAEALGSGMPAEDIILECADVANFVCMLADKKRAKEPLNDRGKEVHE